MHVHYRCTVDTIFINFKDSKCKVKKHIKLLKFDIFKSEWRETSSIYKDLRTSNPSSQICGCIQSYISSPINRAIILLTILAF